MEVSKKAIMVIGHAEIPMDYDKFIDCICSVGGRTKRMIDECYDECVNENDRIKALGFDDIKTEYNYVVDHQKKVKLYITITYDKGRKIRTVLHSQNNDKAYTRDLKDISDASIIVSELSYFNNTNLTKEVSDQFDTLLEMYAVAEAEAKKEIKMNNLIDENERLQKLVDELSKRNKEMKEPYKATFDIDDQDDDDQ